MLEKKSFVPITVEEKEIIETFKIILPALSSDEKNRLKAAASALLVLSTFKQQI